MVAIDSASSCGPYAQLMPMQPRPSAETVSPWVPSRRDCIGCPPPGGSAGPVLDQVLGPEADLGERGVLVVGGPVAGRGDAERAVAVLAQAQNLVVFFR